MVNTWKGAKKMKNPSFFYPMLAVVIGGVLCIVTGQQYSFMEGMILFAVTQIRCDQHGGGS